jgi:hypothetical protein
VSDTSSSPAEQSAEQPVVEIAFGDRKLPQTIAEIEAAIDRAAAGEWLDLTTEHDVIAKYVVPTAAVRGVKSSFRRDAELGWRIALRPRSAAPKRE